MDKNYSRTARGILLVMYSKLLFIVIFFMTPFFVLGEVVPLEAFSEGLRYGVRHAEVALLQKILNTDRETQIASTGAGSPGNETYYFGPATKRALIKFQEKHRDEILTPWGLSRGTGFLGEKTRAKLKTLINKANVADTEGFFLTKQSPKETGGAVFVPKIDEKTTKNSSNEGILPSKIPATSFENKVFVMFPSQYSGKSGTEISISGAGFTPKDNIVSFGAHEITGIPSWNGANLSVKVPEIPKGIYSLLVKNTQGESGKYAFFVVTDGVTPEPKIGGIMPEQALLGSNVVVRGSGFTKTGNMVRTSAEVLENIPSPDGTTLSFRVGGKTFEDMTPEARAMMKKNGKGFPVWVYVVNENGVSKNGMFTLEL